MTMRDMNINLIDERGFYGVSKCSLGYLFNKKISCLFSLSGKERKILNYIISPTETVL